MNHICARSTFVFIVTILFACPNWCHGQAEKNEKDSRELVRLEVKHVDLDYASEIVATALSNDSCELVGDHRSNSLVVYGSPAAITRAKNALAEIDVKPQPKPIAEVSMVALQHVKVEEVAGTIEHLVEDPSCRIVADGVNNALIVSADEQRIKEVLRLAEMLDRPAATEKNPHSTEQSDDCQVRLSWLVESSSFEDKEQKQLRAIRPSLKKLVEHLVAEGGAKKIATLTDVQIISGDGEFRNTSTRELEIGQVAVTVAGSATKDGDKFDLSLDLTFLAHNQEAGLESRFSAPVDHPVAFSVSDIGGIRSYLVIEVSSPDHK